AGLQKKDEPPKPEDPILEHISEINMPKKSLDNTHIYDIGETGFETFKYLIPSKPGDVKGKFSTGSGGIDIGKNPLMDPVYPPDTFKDIEISPELLERIKDTYKKLTGDKDKK
ncbi:hypothetical protein HON01_06245, partial [Candidatus Woesearchaeota archaeon]|nr:hypothetical protein [Candidatus Woesearchaeota archaeon]